MKNKPITGIITASIALASVFFGAQTMAEDYVGGSVSFMKIKDKSDYLYDDSANISSFYGRLGTEFNENFSAEFRLGLGLSDGSLSGNYQDSALGLVNVKGDMSVNQFHGAYVRASLPINGQAYPYLALGYTYMELETKATATTMLGATATITDSEWKHGISYGVGVDVPVNRSVDINFEYMTYYHRSDLSIGGVSVGATYRF